jgi:hypothetical protein
VVDPHVGRELLQHLRQAAPGQGSAAAGDVVAQLCLQAWPVRADAGLPVGRQELGDSLAAVLRITDQLAHDRQRRRMVGLDLRQGLVLQPWAVEKLLQGNSMPEPLAQQGAVDQLLRELLDGRLTQCRQLLGPGRDLGLGPDLPEHQWPVQIPEGELLGLLSELGVIWARVRSTQEMCSG